MFRLVVTLLILAVAVDATKITADLRFKCRLENRFTWQYQVTFLEDDVFSSDDILHRSKTYFTFSSQAQKRFVFYAKGGDGDGLSFDQNYEIRAEVVHNCTPSGKKIVAKVFLGNVPVRSRTAHFRKTLTLY